MNLRRVSKISCPIPGIREPAAEEPLVAGSDHGNAALQAAEYHRRSYCRSFGVSQGTVSEIITEFTPLIALATEEFRPDGEDAKQMTRGRSAGRRHVVAVLVMGARPRDVGREI